MTKGVTNRHSGSPDIKHLAERACELRVSSVRPASTVAGEPPAGAGIRLMPAGRSCAAPPYKTSRLIEFCSNEGADRPDRP